MLANQKIGKSFLGALKYNWKKLSHSDLRRRAELLDTNFTSLAVRDIMKEVKLLRQLRPNLSRYVYHTSLDFTAEEMEVLDHGKLLVIAHDYLAANGFTNNQYMIFRHYDAGHPHLHLLVNRIGFDGTVVSDSNNYKKSEAIIREIAQRYNLITVEPSKRVPQKAAKKDELEMVLRTGKPSDKMVLQELMKRLLDKKQQNLTDIIRSGEAKGMHFLFNQGSTGRVSGITYFYKDFKIKGQALGNRFKWAELIKTIDYGQIRDSKAVSAANSRTRAIYGEWPTTGEQRGTGTDRLYRGGTGDFEAGSGKQEIDTGIKETASSDRAGSLEAGQYAGLYADHPLDHGDDRLAGIGLPVISDDVDDEAVFGKKRRRHKGDEGISR
jgi:Relaxase/Mobilisation nuclease domain